MYQNKCPSVGGRETWCLDFRPLPLAGLVHKTSWSLMLLQFAFWDCYFIITLNPVQISTIWPELWPSDVRQVMFRNNSGMFWDTRVVSGELSVTSTWTEKNRDRKNSGTVLIEIKQDLCQETNQLKGDPLVLIRSNVQPELYYELFGGA